MSFRIDKSQIRENAMKYLLAQFDLRYSKEYQPFDFRDVAFIPAMRGTIEKPVYCLVTPKEVGPVTGAAFA